jgi:hypothetical protein
MAYSTFTTIEGTLDLGGLTADQDGGVFIWKPSIIQTLPSRIGYVWMFDATEQDLGKQFLLRRQAVYIPGTHLEMPNGYTIAGGKLRLVFKWDVAGIPIEVYY